MLLLRGVAIAAFWVVAPGVGVVEGLASYLVQDDRCDLPLEPGTVVMGGPMRRSDAALRCGADGVVTVCGEGWEAYRYVEAVLEAPAGSRFEECDGTLGCAGGTRCAVRCFGGKPKSARLTAPGAARGAWAARYGTVEVSACAAADDEEDGRGVEAVVDWRLGIGCDFTGFFVEVLGLAPALEAALGARRHLKNAIIHLRLGLDCDEAMLASLFASEAATLRRTGARLWGTPIILATVSHGAGCDDGETVDVARLMVERAFGRGRDEAVYACARRARRVWAPSRFSADQFVAAGVDSQRIRLLPEAVDPALLDPARVDADALRAIQALLPRRTKKKKKAKLTVLSVGKFEHRKGFDILLEAFFTAFPSSEDAELILHSQRPAWERGDRDLDAVIAEHRRRVLVGGSRRGDNKTQGGGGAVHWLGNEVALSRAQMRALYSVADVFALATRGEGWGLPIHEAVAFGIPVVATNCSALADWLAPAPGARLVPSRGVDREGFARVAAADVAAALRDVAENRPAAIDRARRVREHVLALYSPAAVAEMAIRHLLDDGRPEADPSAEPRAAEL